MSSKKFSFKTFTSFILVWTFLVLIISGVMLFVSPPGRVAHWTNWTLLGLTKEGWQGVHIWLALVFLIGGIFHLLKFNWKVFVHYLMTKRKGPGYKVEAIVSSILFLIVLVGAIAGIPPFSTFLDFGESVKHSWEAKEGSPPVPHMELKTVREVSAELGIEVSAAQTKLKARNWNIGDADSTLQQLGRMNGVSPQDVFQVLSPQAAGRSGGSASESGQPVQRLGLGRMSVEELSSELGIDLKAELNRMGIEADSHERWKTVAERAGDSPHDLIEKIKTRLR